MIQDASLHQAKPAIVIVPGSFSPASFYADLVTALQSYGHEAIAETLLSSARSPLRGEKAATMQEDAEFFHDIAERLADQGRDVVILTHSYGGLPGTECSKGLSKEERRAAGKPGGISRFVYVTSVVPPPGKSLKDLMGDLVPSFINVEGEFMSHVIEESAKLTFSDMPLEEGMEWVKKMPYHSAPSFEGQLTYPGYNNIPVSFIFCDKDVILPPEFQTSVIESIEKESGKKVDVHHLNIGHCPNVSAPTELAAVVAKAVASGRGPKSEHRL
ncbi:hypothetical protein H2200_007820 [Cladophialophora chaetospira]|uniref:AB hydrolase-1 domain-containing protein n=1 Tax=Cladophialophora chaetospira TaxID=386627 RepID=A0AA38X6H4_9EURO|nr:hypothetical protein H2200_007820 [Cladophialophora chaetospira]